jgi:hypothetical protein
MIEDLSRNGWLIAGKIILKAIKAALLGDKWDISQWEEVQFTRRRI